MLVELAQKFKLSIRSNDLCARWGGEEFLGLFVNADLAEAERVVQRLLDSVRSIALNFQGAEVGITASIGLAQHAFGETYADTFRRADEALLVAKRRGRDRYVIAP
jgi:diguanylate cyclase (GGDEF)-like protein